MASEAGTASGSSSSTARARAARLGQDVLRLNLYRVLGVPRTATPEQLRRAYRLAARATHPDLQTPQAKAAAARQMVELNVAASVLLDPARRAAYDAAHAAEPAGTPRAEPFYPWASGVPSPSRGAHTDADAREDWVSVHAGPASPPDDVTADLSDVRGLRGAPARTLERVLRFMDGRTPGGHVSLTLASIAIAFLLIASARPRSLFPPPEVDQTIAACDLGAR